jgi:peroxiredoxin 5
MQAWAADQQGVLTKEGSIITFMGDPAGEFTKAVGMEMTHPGPIAVGIIGRCKRFAMIVVNNIVQYVAVSERPDDPAGDDDPSATCVEAMLEAVGAQQDA